MAVAITVVFLPKGTSYALTEGGRKARGLCYSGGQLTVPWGSGTRGMESSRPLCRGDSDLHHQYFSQQQWRFLSYGFFLLKDTGRGERCCTKCSLTSTPLPCILCSETSNSASSAGFQLCHQRCGTTTSSWAWGPYARRRMTPLSEPSKRWHFVGSTARLVSVPRKFSELSLVVLMGRAEDSSME